jgi:hypothetical protein
MLNSKKIISAVIKARMDYKNNVLSKDILDSTHESFWITQNNADYKKEKLIELAKKNAKRPIKRTSVLGNALCNYTSPDKATYDAEFTQEIKRLAPHWFQKSSDSAKESLLKLAKKKCPKPKYTSSLYKKLSEYTNKSRSSYDAKFHSIIQKLAPHWFVNTSETKKKDLLELAKKGGARPRPKLHELGYALQSYCKPSANVYDPKFVAQIKRLAPHWFRSV